MAKHVFAGEATNQKTGKAIRFKIPESMSEVGLESLCRSIRFISLTATDIVSKGVITPVEVNCSSQEPVGDLIKSRLTLRRVMRSLDESPNNPWRKMTCDMAAMRFAERLKSLELSTR